MKRSLLTTICVSSLLLLSVPPKGEAVPVSARFESSTLHDYDGRSFRVPSAATFPLAKTADTLLFADFSLAPGFAGIALSSFAIGAEGIALHVDVHGGEPTYFREVAGGGRVMIGAGTYDLPGGGFFELGERSFAWRAATGEHLEGAVTETGVVGVFTKNDNAPSRGLFDGEFQAGLPTFSPAITSIVIPTTAAPLAPTILEATAVNPFPSLPVAGEFLRYDWDFDGDGAFDASGNAVETAFDRGQHDVHVRVTNNYGFYSDRVARIHVVPEPGTFALLLTALAGLGVRRCRGRSSEREQTVLR